MLNISIEFKQGGIVKDSKKIKTNDTLIELLLDIYKKRPKALEFARKAAKNAKYN